MESVNKESATKLRNTVMGTDGLGGEFSPDGSN
jgi:hypothetical protein